MNKFRTFLLGMSAVVALTVLTACGGSDDKGSVLNNGGSSSSSPSSSSSSGSSSGSNGSSSSGGTLDLSKAAKGIQDLKSFNFDVTLKMNLGDLGSSSSGSSGSGLDLSGVGALLGNVKATGAYQAPDKMSLQATAIGQQFQFVQVGNKTYTKTGTNAKWTEGSSSDGPLGSLSPSSLGSSASSVPPDALKNAKTSKETVNGIKATRYTFDRAAIQALTKDAGSSAGAADDAFKDFDKAQMDIWVSDDGGIPVKMTMDLSGKDDKKKDIGMQLEFNLKDLNSSSIQIKAPI